MLDRKDLSNLVVMTLQHSDTHPKASELYMYLRTNNPSILRDESVKGFRSFVKILNSFDCIEVIGSGLKRYTLKK